MKLGEKVFGGVIVAIFDSVVEGVSAIAVGDVGVCAVLNEELEHFDIAVSGGGHQWRFAPPWFLAVGVGALLEKFLGGTDFVVLAGVEEFLVNRSHEW